MNDFEPASVQRPDADLAKQRSEIRRGLNRANLASVIILIVVIGLSLGAVLQAFRAERNAQEAQRSRRAAEADLLRAQQSEAQALLDQSRAQRRSPTQPPFSTLQRCSTKPSPSLPCLLSNSFRSGPIQFLLSFSLLQTSGISQFEMMEKSNC